MWSVVCKKETSKRIATSQLATMSSRPQRKSKLACQEAMSKATAELRRYKRALAQYKLDIKAGKPATKPTLSAKAREIAEFLSKNGDSSDDEADWSGEEEPFDDDDVDE